MDCNDDAALICASSFFDLVHYQAATGLEFESAVAAAQHYLDEGCARQLSPSPAFDPAFYLARNDDVAVAGINPLAHFLRYGRKEGRLPRLTRSPRAAHPVAPPPDAWIALRERIIAGANHPDAHLDTPAAVDVVIPVYRGLDETLACIHSVLTAEVRTPYRLVVIDDEGPEVALSDALVRLSELGLIHLLRNDHNLGFVGTANRGMFLSGERDVILLNSDTEVYADWIDRLRDHAYGSDRVATVTPYSNNATIFSYPFFAESNNQQLEIGFAELDAMFRRANARRSVAVPTGVGFCFYIRRTAIDELGALDEALFGKGYGEENDFCMRAVENAWVNLAALDTFVRHTGEVSFGPNAGAGKRAGYRRLLATHPRYAATIARYIERDPLKPGRERVDVERFARASAGRGILMIEHGWGGGIERHIADLVTLLDGAGVSALVCSPVKGVAQHRLRHATSDDFPNLSALNWGAVEQSAQLLRALNLGHVHIHSLLASSEDEVAGMLAAIRMAGLEYSFTVHDYAPICPRITMVDWGGTYCDSPSAAYCRRCIARDDTPFGPVDIDDWRSLYATVLDGARRIIVPSHDTADRLRRFGIARRALVRPHPVVNVAASARARSPQSATATPDGTIRVGVIGAIGTHKGSRLLRTLCADAASRHLPLRFTLYGYTDTSEDAALPNFEMTGAYAEADLADLLRERRSDLALFLSVWPETFCYTLDHAFDNRLFPICFDLGAPAQRIKATGFGRTMPLSYMFDPARINDLLVALGPPETCAVVEEGRIWSSAEAYYDLHPAAAPDRAERTGT